MTNVIPRLSIILLIALLLVSCGDDEAGGTEEQTTVVATTSIISALAEEVGGDRVQIETLMGPGVDPHTFELRPGDVRTIADADVVLVNGLGLDDFLLDEIESATESSAIVVVTDGIDLLEGGQHDEHDDQEDNGDFDPHVWQDPLRVKVMVDNIAEVLAEADPDNASTYHENAGSYNKTLDETHQEIQALIDQIPDDHRKIVTNHEAFAYFADRYGLEIVGTVIPGITSEADPSAGQIAELTELIEQEHVQAIFAEALIDPKVAESLAADTGVKIVYDLYTGQVGEEGSGAETVHGMLLANAEKISEALQ